MGLEARCTVRHGREFSSGTALLETDELIFRGEFRLRIPIAGIRGVSVADGVLRVRWSGGEASFALGPPALKWADRILHPRSLIDKLDVKPGHRVAVLGITDAAFLDDLRARVSDLTTGRTRQGSDSIFVVAERHAALSRLGRLQRAILPTGAIWVLWPKGRDDINENDVRAAGRGLGLVDVKVVRFSETHGALKLVVPLANRPKAEQAKRTRPASAPAKARIAKLRRGPTQK
ncbi:MAG: DUF3052 family protein [Candidatus Eisenbacteria bacterium]|nr:DUF3052 family protein [Candidatus Eisenbacteria bacterium]